MGDGRPVSLVAAPLTRERFAPYGDVIETAPGAAQAMNEARFERFDDLCDVDLAGGEVAISIARCRTPTSLPLRIDRVERHPLGSQAFVPLQPCRMILVVAPPGEAVSADELRAFVSNGRQGINYHRGTWHLPLVGLEAGLAFLVVDRGGPEPNCVEHELDEAVIVEAI